jgi:hypothetical protein
MTRSAGSGRKSSMTFDCQTVQRTPSESLSKFTKTEKMNSEYV